MIDAGRWAPNSGDRQPWRFLIMVEKAEKHLLKHVKEQHCYDAPCLIFVGADKRVYGGLGDNEAGLHIDGGAAIMQMVLAAHASHFGVCWNHFSRDLIESRPKQRRDLPQLRSEDADPRPHRADRHRRVRASGVPSAGAAAHGGGVPAAARSRGSGIRR